MKNPCYKCEKRAPGCHSDCEDYLKWDKEHKESKAKAYQDKQAQLHTYPHSIKRALKGKGQP